MKTYIFYAYFEKIRARYYIEAKSKKAAVKKLIEKSPYLKKWKIKKIKLADRSLMEVGTERI